MTPPPPAAQPVVADEAFWISLLRDFTRARHVSGCPITHRMMKRYRDVLRHLEKQEARRVARSH